MDTLQAHEVFNEHLVKGTPDRDVSPQMSSGERREQYKVASGKAVDQPSEVPQAVVPSQGPSSGTGDAHPEPEHQKLMGTRRVCRNLQWLGCSYTMIVFDTHFSKYIYRYNHKKELIWTFRDLCGQNHA